MKPKPLPGIPQRPSWPQPVTHRTTSPAPPLTLARQIIDTPEAHREAQRLTGQLALIEEDDDVSALR